MKTIFPHRRYHSDCPTTDRLGRCSDALQMMERNLRGTVKPDGNYGRSDPNRRVTSHRVIAPRTRSHVPWQIRRQSKRNRSRQADLTSVGVASQKQFEAGICCLLVDLWCM